MFAIQDVLGGRAHLRGVTFYSEKYASTSILEKNKLRTNLIKRNTHKTVFSRLTKIPFLRGVFILIESMWFVGKWFKIIVSIYALMLLGQILLTTYTGIQPVGMSGIFEKYNIPPSIVYILFSIAVGFVRFSSIGQYHGAEHKAANAHDLGLDLTVDNVKKMSRVSKDCGTNFIVFVTAIFAFLINFMVLPLTLILSISIAYEIFKVGKEKWFLKPFYMLGSIVQKYIVTAEPTDSQIKVAISSLENLVKQN